MNIDKIRSEFPITKEVTYLQIAGMCPLANPVKESIDLFMSKFQKKDSVKSEWRMAMNEAKILFADIINAKPSEIAFVKNTTDGMCIAINGIKMEPGDNIVISELEHPNQKFPWLYQEKKGVEIRLVPPHGNRVELDDIASKIDSRTRAVGICSITALGLKYDIPKLNKICKETGTSIVLDAVQSLGNEPLDVKKLGIDFLSSSCHKGLLTPAGIGYLYVNEGVIDDIDPMCVGSRSYQRIGRDKDWTTSKLLRTAGKFEYGNQNYLGITASVAALNFLKKVGVKDIHSRGTAMAECFRNGLISIGAKPFEYKKEERCHIVPFTVPGKSREEVVKKLKENKVITADSYGKAIRASFGLFNNNNDVDKALKIIEEYF